MKKVGYKPKGSCSFAPYSIPVCSHKLIWMALDCSICDLQALVWFSPVGAKSGAFSVSSKTVLKSSETRNTYMPIIFVSQKKNSEKKKLKDKLLEFSLILLWGKQI